MIMAGVFNLKHVVPYDYSLLLLDIANVRH